MTPDPKLVEALAHTILRFTGFGIERYPEAHATALSFFDAHRLVQLPEEPSGWEVEYKANGWDQNAFIHKEDAAREAIHHRMATGRIRPVWTIPGDPQEVEP